MVWKADEAWIRSFLAGEVELPVPEEPEAPMEQVENVEETVEEVAEAVEPEEPKPEEEVVAEVAAEAPVEAPLPEVTTDLPAVVEPTEVIEEMHEDVAMEDVVHETIPTAFVEGSHMPEPIEELVAAINKENT